MRYLFFLSIISVINAFDKDQTFYFSVQAGKLDCFYQPVQAGQVVDIEYQVIDATHTGSEMDISFQMSDPVGKLLVADYKKSENAHRHTADLSGDYRFCFDNSFSMFSEKTVFFDFMIGDESEGDKDYDDEKEMELGNAADTYMMRVRDIMESVNRVKDNMSTARRLQEQLSAHEARDRNVAEEMCSRVQTWSMIQIVVLLLVAVTQIIFVKQLFDDDRRKNGFDVKKYMSYLK